VDKPARPDAAPRLAGRCEQYVPGGNGDLDEDFEGNELTSDPGRFARNAAIPRDHPTLGIGSSTVAWVNAAFDTIAAFRVTDYPAKITKPMLILGAGEDTIVSTDAGKRFAERLPAGKHCVIEGARHEILQEQDKRRAKFWAEFDAFIP
jgi:lysophospholipase